MAGRNRMPRHPTDFHGNRDHRPMVNRGPGPLPVYPVALEEELEMQHRENQRIATENRHLIDENVNLERDLVAAKDEIHRLDEVILKLRADNDVKFRNLIERSLKMEADLRAAEPLREEVMRLRGEAQKLNVMRQDLTGQIQGLSQDVARLRSENKQLSAMRSDVDGIRKELNEARRALEYEKKANGEQVEQKEVMEKNLMSMAREIEKLRAEQLRGHGLGNSGGSSYGTGTVGSGYGSSTGGSGYGSIAGGSSYGMYNGIPDVRYAGEGPVDGRYAGGGPADGYGGAWGSYNKRPRR